MNKTENLKNGVNLGTAARSPLAGFKGTGSAVCLSRGESALIRTGSGAEQAPRSTSVVPAQHMKTILKVVFTAVALGVASTCLNAQSAVPHRHAPGQAAEGKQQHGPPLIALLDVNQDGVLDAAEMAQAPAQLKSLDKNSDGIVSLEEIGGIRGVRAHRQGPPVRHSATRPTQSNEEQGAAPPAPPAPPHVPMPPFVAALDVNQDGAFDADEIANAAAALKALDKNANGQLDRDEYRPQPPERPAAPAHRVHRNAPRTQE